MASVVTPSTNDEIKSEGLQERVKMGSMVVDLFRTCAPPTPLATAASSNHIWILDTSRIYARFVFAFEQIRNVGWDLHRLSRFLGP